MKSVLRLISHLLTLLVCANGEGSVTLTTAVFRDDAVSLMPTSRYRRIAIGKSRESGGVQLRASLELLFHKKKSLRQSGAAIWNWDYWCQEQPQKGSCSKKLEKYYYDTQMDNCRTFNYSGCEGNENNFDTNEECDNHCKGSAFMSTKSIGRSVSCTFQPNVGLCFVLYDRYYYDVNEKTCKSFKFSGCGGNKNRFPTKEKCLMSCAN